MRSHRGRRHPALRWAPDSSRRHRPPAGADRRTGRTGCPPIPAAPSPAWRSTAQRRPGTPTPLGVSVPHPASVNRAIATAENDPPVLIATPKDRPVVTVRVVPTGVDKGGACLLYTSD